MSGPRPSPHKWLKYELLNIFGLADISYLHKTIHRRPRSEHAAFMTELTHEVRLATENGHRDGQDYLFVVKFVPDKVAMMLQNVRIRCMADLRAVKQLIREPSGEYQELWFCRTNVSSSAISVAGRMVVDSTAGMEAQVVEQVWRCSPRLIETLSPSFPYPFVRGRRIGWGWSLKIDEIHLPTTAPESQESLRQQLATALVMLDEGRDKLEIFCKEIEALGLSVCLEYKIEGRRLQIIDWDTPNDSLVLAKLLRI